MKEWMIGQLCLLVKSARGYVNDDILLAEYIEKWLDRMVERVGTDGKKI